MTSREPITSGKRHWTGPAPEQELYQEFSTEEDRHRTNLHYERPAEFFVAITGGEWNTYSANLWDGAVDDTRSQEAKLDLLAELMDLRPGQRILDVGCGWAGPLVYLSTRYGVRGVGLTLSTPQKRYAEERVARHGADVQIVQSHWREFRDAEGFDAVYTDEVIVHFNDLGGFFSKVHELLRPGGRMVNKELHFTNSRHARITRSTAPINEIFGATGNYRTLAQELELVDRAGFDVHQVHTFARHHYPKTVDRWLANMHQHRERLRALVGDDYYRDFRRYLKLGRQMVASPLYTLNAVVAEKS